MSPALFTPRFFDGILTPPCAVMKNILTESLIVFSERDDSWLANACLDGDPVAWESLIDRYQRLIYSIPIRARLSPDDAADIFQSVCLKLYETLPKIRDHERISSWLITTTSRECWRIAARNRREHGSLGCDENAGADCLGAIHSPEPLADEQREILEQQQLVREAVQSLPDRCRQLITMLFYGKDEFSYADVARRMKMPVPSVGPTRARCLEKLKRLLQDRL